MTAYTSWFEVDAEGLRKLLSERGEAVLIYELLQNAWDENVTRVTVALVPTPYRPEATLAVEDDSPEGFADLTHAYTLFAESPKKADPSKRGRWNLGEKLVVACCKSATVKTTKGTVEFLADGSRKVFTDDKHRRPIGSLFLGDLRLTRSDYSQVCRNVCALIPPDGVKTVFNGERLQRPELLREFEVVLPTVISDDDGNLRPTLRNTTVEVFRLRAGEQSMIFEGGIPVVEDEGGIFLVNVLQKVPLNFNRDNVTPAYLRKLRTAVLNNTFDLVEDPTAPWVQDATSSLDVCRDAFRDVFTKRFGDKVVSFDPSDQEANHTAASEGYVVLAGGTLSKEQWSNVRRFKVSQAAGQVCPTPKPYGEDGEEINVVPYSELTDGHKRVVEYLASVGHLLLDHPIRIRFVRQRNWVACATYGPKSPLTIDLNSFTEREFSNWVRHIGSWDALLLHELAHEYESDHLSDKYHSAICRLGAKLKKLALEGRLPNLIASS